METATEEMVTEEEIDVTVTAVQEIEETANAGTTTETEVLQYLKQQIPESDLSRKLRHLQR